MCKCTPEIKTPFCGKPGCEWPPESPKSLRSRAARKNDEALQLDRQARQRRDEAREYERKADELEMALNAKIPVDRSQRVMTSGGPETPDHREPKENGQQKDYVILSAAERAKGFVRPVRRTYVHQKCGGATTMSQDIAETYARDPFFYSGTFCVGCRAHFPVGEDGEFTWDDGSKVGT